MATNSRAFLAKLQKSKKILNLKKERKQEIKNEIFKTVANIEKESK